MKFKHNVNVYSMMNQKLRHRKNAKLNDSERLWMLLGMTNLQKKVAKISQAALNTSCEQQIKEETIQSQFLKLLLKP